MNKSMAGTEGAGSFPRDGTGVYKEYYVTFQADFMLSGTESFGMHATKTRFAAYEKRYKVMYETDDRSMYIWIISLLSGLVMQAWLTPLMKTFVRNL